MHKESHPSQGPNARPAAVFGRLIGQRMGLPLLVLAVAMTGCSVFGGADSSQRSYNPPPPGSIPYIPYAYHPPVAKEPSFFERMFGAAKPAPPETPEEWLAQKRNDWGAVGSRKVK